jgi:hypothetical protein
MPDRRWTRRRIARLLLTAALPAVLIPGCTERRESPVGLDLNDPERRGGGPFELVVRAERDTSFEDTGNGGAGPELYVGSEGDVRLRTLLRFETLPEADSIIRATVKLRRADGWSSGAFDIQAFPVVTAWEELLVTWEMAAEDSLGESVPWARPGGDFDAVSAGRFAFSDAEGDTLYEMGLDAGLVQDWIDGTRENEGVILIASGEGGGTGFASFVSRQSTDGVGEPALEIEYVPPDAPDSTAVTEVRVTNDVFLALFEGQVDPARPLLGDVPGFRTFLRFDLAGFDSTWTIVRADLGLLVVDGSRVHDDLHLEASALTSEWSGADTEADPAIIASTVVAEDDTLVELNLTGLVQLWVTGDFDNDGVGLRMGRATDEFGYLAIDGAAAGEEARRPFLRIVYHTPGEAPFRPSGPPDRAAERETR